MVRRKVRAVLNIRAGFGKTEGVLLDGVNELTGGGVSLDELRDAVEWNISQGYVRCKFDEEDEVRMWFITAAGQAQEEVK